MRPSPHGDVLMYRWNLQRFSCNPPLPPWRSSSTLSWPRPFCQSSSWPYRKSLKQRLDTTSAWQSWSTAPFMLMYSPLMHFVPVATVTTFTSPSSRSPWVITMPASTFHLALSARSAITCNGRPHIHQ
ncbi:unnamed protein product [Ixodes persulcatus]